MALTVLDKSIVAAGGKKLAIKVSALSLRSTAKVSSTTLSFSINLIAVMPI